MQQRTRKTGGWQQSKSFVSGDCVLMRTSGKAPPVLGCSFATQGPPTVLMTLEMGLEFSFPQFPNLPKQVQWSVYRLLDRKTLFWMRTCSKATLSSIDEYEAFRKSEAGKPTEWLAHFGDLRIQTREEGPFDVLRVYEQTYKEELEDNPYYNSRNLKFKKRMDFRQHPDNFIQDGDEAYYGINPPGYYGSNPREDYHWDHPYDTDVGYHNSE
jgi:hypothetical protein